MPPQRSVFEGPTPESVILDACSEFGPDVQLSEPEEIREGGVLGFFAKRAYRVRVNPPANGGSVLAVDVTDTEPAGSVLDRMLAASPDFDLDVDIAEAPAVAPATLAPPAAAAAPQVKAPASFDDALARAAGALGVDYPREGGAGDAFDSLVARLRGEEEEEQDELAQPAALALADRVAEEVPTPIAPVENLDRRVRDEVPPPLAAPAPPISPAGLRAGSARVVAALSSVAFPTQLLAAAAGRLPVGFGVEEVLGTLPAPRPLPHVPGSLIAVVGVDGDASRHARRIASELGLDPMEVAIARTTSGCGGKGRHSRGARNLEADRPGADDVAPDLYVERPEDAAALSPGWRRDRIGIVAVEIAPTPDAAMAGRAMLRALRPSQTLLVAHATQKAADVAYLAQGLGGADALLLDNLAGTTTPCEVLAAEVPVLTLEGDKADATTWVRHIEATLDRRGATEGL